MQVSVVIRHSRQTPAAVHPQSAARSVEYSAGKALIPQHEALKTLTAKVQTS